MDEKLIPPDRLDEVTAKQTQQVWSRLTLVFMAFHEATTLSGDTSHLRAAPRHPPAYQAPPKAAN